MLLSTIKSSPPEDCIFNHLEVNRVDNNYAGVFPSDLHQDPLRFLNLLPQKKDL
jgi:hypothetical protein